LKTRRYLIQNSFAFWIGIAGILGGSVYLLVPEALSKSSIGTTARFHLDYLWAIMYFIGGLLTVYGIIKISPRNELAGMCLFVSALLINGFAVVVTFGWRGIPNGIIVLSLSAACLGRAIVLWEAYKLDRAVRQSHVR
jgi:hypothetical protein